MRSGRKQLQLLKPNLILRPLRHDSKSCPVTELLVVQHFFSKLYRGICRGAGRNRMRQKFLRLVLGEESPTFGSVRVDAKPVTRVDSRCGYVPQKYSLFPDRTVMGNVMYGPENAQSGLLGRWRPSFRRYRRNPSDKARGFACLSSRGQSSRGQSCAISFFHPLLSFSPRRSSTPNSRSPTAATSTAVRCRARGSRADRSAWRFPSGRCTSTIRISTFFASRDAPTRRCRSSICSSEKTAACCGTPARATAISCRRCGGSCIAGWKPSAFGSQLQALANIRPPYAGEAGQRNAYRGDG